MTSQPLLFDDSGTLPLLSGCAMPYEWRPYVAKPVWTQLPMPTEPDLPWRIGEWDIIPVHHAGAEHYAIRKMGNQFCERDYQDGTLIVWQTHAAAADYLSDMECSRYPTPGE